MKCNDATACIMKYMDGDITETEAETLNEHLLTCSHCKEEFLVYDSILLQFSELPQWEAPESFEMEVMAKIKCLSPTKVEVTITLKDRVLRSIWGISTVLFGSGAVLVLYRDPIMNSLSTNPFIGTKIQGLMPLAEEMAKSTESLKAVLIDTIHVTDTVLTNSMGLLFAVLTGLCAIQFYLLRRRKKMNKADES